MKPKQSKKRKPKTKATPSLHAVAGLPRAGTTLLCNILAQNPAFYASSTSMVSQLVANCASTWSGSPILKSDLIHDQQGTEDRIVASLRGLIAGWYPQLKDQHVFDKDRSWMGQPHRFHTLYPKGRIIVCVRDIRSVLASIEKQHQRFAILDEAGGDLSARSLEARAAKLLAPDGLIGSCVRAVVDLCHRANSWVVIVSYERLAKAPENTLNELYDDLGLPSFKHDFESVKNVSTDIDGLYLNKFPHSGEGRVIPSSYKWSDYVPVGLGNTIIEQFPTYNRTFKYS